MTRTTLTWKAMALSVSPSTFFRPNFPERLIKLVMYPFLSSQFSTIARFDLQATQHFGDILSNFIGSLATIRNDLGDLPQHLRRACIAHKGKLTALYEYIPRVRVRASSPVDNGRLPNYHYRALVSLSGHLFDHFLINESLDAIEAGGGSFHLLKCEVGQNGNATSYSELQVSNPDQFRFPI